MYSLLPWQSCSAHLASAATIDQRMTCPVADDVAGIGGSFYLGYSWLPSFFVTYAGLPTMLTLWMVLTSMVVFTIVVPIAGVLSDRGTLRPVTATIAICVIAAGMSVPMFLAFQTKNLAACWLLQIVSLCLTAYTMGVLPVICSNIYPAGVRISGFNLGYNLGKWHMQRDALTILLIWGLTMSASYLMLQVYCQATQPLHEQGSECACPYSIILMC